MSRHLHNSNSGIAVQQCIASEYLVQDAMSTINFFVLLMPGQFGCKGLYLGAKGCIWDAELCI